MLANITRGVNMTRLRDNYFNVCHRHARGSSATLRGLSAVRELEIEESSCSPPRAAPPTGRKGASEGKKRGGGERVLAAVVAGVATAFRPNVKSAVCRSDATVMSTNIYLIGCSPRDERSAQCYAGANSVVRAEESPLPPSPSSPSLSDIVGKDKASVCGGGE